MGTRDPDQSRIHCFPWRFDKQGGGGEKSKKCTYDTHAQH